MNTTDVRSVLAPLVEFAGQQNVVVIGIMHFSKKASAISCFEPSGLPAGLPEDVVWRSLNRPYVFVSHTKTSKNCIARQRGHIKTFRPAPYPNGSSIGS
jgi:hypothetical protein